MGSIGTYQIGLSRILTAIGNSLITQHISLYRAPWKYGYDKYALEKKTMLQLLRPNWHIKIYVEETSCIHQTRQIWQDLLYEEYWIIYKLKMPFQGEKTVQFKGLTSNHFWGSIDTRNE